MKLPTFSLFALLAGLSSAQAQLNVPVNSVTLAFPAISGVTLQLGATTRSGLPTPFLLSTLAPAGGLWFCMDPLQNAYYQGSGQPPGAQLHFDSTNPADFDKWTPAAPGLNAAGIQNLADLFTAYFPTTNNQLLGGALQIAVWEIVNEFDANPFSLTGGQMRVSGNAAMIAAAQNMLDSLDDVGVMNRGNVAGLNFLIDGRYQGGPIQDLVSFDLVPSNSITPVPEPSTYGMGAAAVLILGIMGRRFAKKNRSA